MPIDFPISQLPLDLAPVDAVEAAYGSDADWVTDKLRRQVSCLLECDKQLVPWLYPAIRQRLKQAAPGEASFRCRFVSGQHKPDGEAASATTSLLQLMAGA